MSLAKVKTLHSIPSARVKSLDFHPTQPLVLATLYSGEAIIVDCLLGSITKTFPVHTGIPLRAGKWIPQNGDIVLGGDKQSIHFFSPTKGKLILEVSDAHGGYIRALAVHPNEMLLLSSSDDQTVKLWDIKEGCRSLRVFQYHTGLVMDVRWNPRDLSTFSSCSLDGTTVFWEISNEQPRFSQKISSKCLNSISLAACGDRAMLAAGSDDKDVHLWDMQTRSLIAKLEGHEHNVTRVEFHPSRPVIISTGEDNMTFIWSTATFKRENSINARLERGWAISISESLPLFAVGYDKGLMIGKFVHSGVPMSLDVSGKLAMANGSEISVTTVKGVGEIVDGAQLNLMWKDALATEVPPIELLYSPNGRYLTTVSDGEWTVYTSLGFRSRAFGKGLKFAWASDSNNFAVVDTGFTVSVYNGFDRTETLPVYARKIWGGDLLSVSANGQLEFYDWASLKLMRRIDAKASEVKWCNELVAIRTKNSIFVLEFNPNCQQEVEEEGFEDAFTVLHQLDVKSTSICWYKGVLFFAENVKISRLVGGVVQTAATLKVPMEILGYLPKDDLLVLVNSQRKVCGVNFPDSLLRFEVDVANGEDPEAEDVPEKYRSRCAKFLRQMGKNELALELTTDSAMKFELALELNQLEIAEKAASDQNMWRRLARAALAQGDFDLAVKAIKNCGDFSTLLMLFKAKNKPDEMRALVDEAEQAGQLNVAFSAALLTNQKQKCVELLLKSGKYAEAALYARSNVPSMTSECVRLWREHIPNKKLADPLADPAEYPNLFDELVTQDIKDE